MARGKGLLAVAAVGVALTVGTAGPGLAAPQEGSCGFGSEGARQLIENERIKKKQQRPGAGEASQFGPEQCNESEKN